MTGGALPGASGADPGGREERIAAILSECSDRLNAGEALDPRAVLTGSPDLLPELEWAVRALLESTAVPGGGPCFETIGRHRLLREIGRGGMGIVYDAVDLTLGRRVALKVLPLPAFLETSQRERFLREARAASRLHHTHIVPVFEVGQEGGLFYYTMQHISGRSLDHLLAALRRRSTAEEGAGDAGSPDATAAALAAGLAGGEGHGVGSKGWHLAVARIGAGMAGALAHAHGEGVLHRDVKPSNIIIDEQACPWLTDFGLAKCELETEGLTRSGDVVGTLAYMAPERLGGDGDARSDVYSLGAALYEMLTLRPPFRDLDRGRLLQLVAGGEAPRPRRLEPRIPRDLETIVLKAMAREPHRRYPSAERLGEDLERFLRGETISARRSGPLERLGRWSRRHPLVAGLAGAVAALLVTLVVVSTSSAVSLRQRLFESELARARVLLVSGQPGRRFESLAAIQRAAALAAGKTAREALRDAAIQALSRVDIRELVRRPEPLLAAAGSAFDPDLERYAVFDRERAEIVLRDVLEGRELQRLGGAADVKSIAAISPGGRFLAAQRFPGGRSTLRLWRLADGEVWLDGELATDPLRVSFEPRGQALAVARPDGTIAFIDLDSRAEKGAWKPPAPPSVLKFSPSGRELAVALSGGSTVEVRHPDQGYRVATIHGDTPPADLAWSPDGLHLATVSFTDEHIRLWDARTGDLLRVLAGHTGGVVRVAYSPRGGTLASTSWDGTLRLWDPFNGDLLLSTTGAALSEFSRDGRRLISYGKALVVWSVEPGEERRVHKSPAAPSAAGGQYQQFHPGGRLLLHSWHLWDIRRAEEVPVDLWPGAVPTVFHPSGRALLVSSKGGVREHPFELLEGPEEDVLRLGRTGRLLDLAVGAGALALDGSGTRLAALEPGNRVVLLELGEEGRKGKTTLGVHPGSDRLSVSRDGRWAASGTFNRGRGIRIWDLTALRHAGGLEEEDTARPTFSPDGRWLAASSSAAFNLYEVGSWTRKRTFPRATDTWLIGPLAWHPDGKRIAVAITPSEIQLYDIDSGEAVGRLGGDELRLAQVLDFSPDGEFLALGRANATTEVWDLRRIGEGLARLGLELPGQTAGPERGEGAPRRVRVEWLDAHPRVAAAPAERHDVDDLPVEALKDAWRLHAAATRLVADGDWQAVLRLWERALAADPGSWNIANSLAWALVTCPAGLRDPARAVPLAEAAVRGAKGNAAFLNTLGAAYYRAGRFREAVDALLASVRATGSATAWDGFFLAMALERLGLRALAEDYHENANRWLHRHPSLPKAQLDELRAFQAEAREVLGGSSPAARGEGR